MKRIALLFVSVVAAAGLLGIGQVQTVGAASTEDATAASSVAGTKDKICEGAGIAGTDCNDKGAPLNNLLKAALNILSVIVGIAAIVMIIIAGLKYITSAGDASGIASAKNTLIYAIVGLVIVALAQIIVKFVLETTKKSLV